MTEHGIVRAALLMGMVLGAALQGALLMPGIIKDRVNNAFESCWHVPRENFKKCVLLDFK